MKKKLPEPPVDLRIGGFVPFTSVDFPGHLAAVIFCQGCTWRCRYCHNPHLQTFESEGSAWSWDLVSRALDQRQGFLEAVVFSGGEPTAQAALGPAMQAVRRMGYKIGLHTAGAFRARLAEVLPFVDWVGFDVKAPLDGRYRRITGRPDREVEVKESLELILRSGVPVEIRTTRHEYLLSDQDLEDLQRDLQSVGAGPAKIQQFRPEGCLDPELLAFGKQPPAKRH